MMVVFGTKIKSTKLLKAHAPPTSSSPLPTPNPARVSAARSEHPPFCTPPTANIKATCFQELPTLDKPVFNAYSPKVPKSRYTLYAANHVVLTSRYYGISSISKTHVHPTSFSDTSNCSLDIQSCDRSKYPNLFWHVLHEQAFATFSSFSINHVVPPSNKKNQQALRNQQALPSLC